VSRWFDAVIEDNSHIDSVNVRAPLLACAELPDPRPGMKPAMDKLDLLVVIDPFRSATRHAAMPKDRTPSTHPPGPRGVPAARATQFEPRLVHGVEPLAAVARARDRAVFDGSDQAIMIRVRAEMGFADQLLGRKGGRQNIRLVK